MKRLKIVIFFTTLTCTLAAQNQISGEIVFPDGLPICNVLVELRGNDDVVIAQDLSEADGTFRFSDVTVGTGYQLTFLRDGEAINGTSTFDLVLLSRLILGVDNFQPYNLWIGDVNNSGTLTTLDLIYIRRLILQLVDELPGPIWGFDEPDAVVPDGRILIDELNENLDLEVIGVKRADLNGSVTLDCQ